MMLLLKSKARGNTSTNTPKNIQRYFPEPGGLSVGDVTERTTDSSEKLFSWFPKLQRLRPEKRNQKLFFAIC
jgi:hypothetical protein